MPKIERVKADLKFTRAVQLNEKGEPIAWKSLGLGAEATVLANETYEIAQQSIYHEVASQLRLLFREKMDDTTAPPRQEAQAAVGDEEIEEPPAPPVDPSWCPIHEAKMKYRSWGGYSHKVGQQWCQGHWCAIHKTPLFKNEDKDGGVWFTHVHEDPHTGERIWCRGKEGPQSEPPTGTDEWPEEEIPF